MSSYQENNYKAHQKTKTQIDETDKVSEPDMTGMLVLSEREFEVTMIIILKALINKVNSM